jgi:transcriptional regulator with XRE-family HTH domain
MNLVQAKNVADLIRSERVRRGLSASEVARRARVAKSTVTRLEQQVIAHPVPENIRAIGRVLDISDADLFVAAGWVGEGDLPGLGVYLKVKYRDIPDEGLADIEQHFKAIVDRYGLTLAGPVDAEDE